MAKKVSTGRLTRQDRDAFKIKRKDPHKPKNKHKARDYKAYRGQGK